MIQNKNRLLSFNSVTLTLLVLFILSLVVRFLYFPGNVYFAYDQARDSYFATEILKGDIRLIGPPSAASTKLFPGPLSLYLYAIVYFIFSPNPETLSAFFRIYNALGVFLVFLIGSKLFSKKVGILSSILFAVSYEQSQYALFMSHQPLALIPVLTMYLGLIMFCLEKNTKGLLLSLLGLGLAIQFHYVYILLIPIVLVIIIVTRKSLPKLKLKEILLPFGVFLLTVSSYIISEFRFNFRMLSTIFSSSSGTGFYINEAIFAAKRFVYDTFWGNYTYAGILLIISLFVFSYLIVKSTFRYKVILLFLWFVGGIIPYFVSGTSSYYYSAGASASLVILFSFLVTRLYKSVPVIAIVLFSGVIMNNYFLIRTQNPLGPNKDMVIQPQMLLREELNALSYIYHSADQKPFAVNALTIPLNVNTTWSFLFEWYGKGYFGYLPVWSGKPAEGFPGGLPYLSERSKLPETQFSIVESTLGIRDHDKERFFVEENYFTSLVEEKKFGTIVVQKRIKK